MALLLLGHFAEGGGEHYVCLQAHEDFIQDRLTQMDSLQLEAADHCIQHFCRTDDDIVIHPIGDNSSDHIAVDTEEEEQPHDCTAVSILFNEPLTGVELPFVVLNLIMDYVCAVDILRIFIKKCMYIL